MYSRIKSEERLRDVPLRVGGGQEVFTILLCVIPSIIHCIALEQNSNWGKEGQKEKERERERDGGGQRGRKREREKKRGGRGMRTHGHSWAK